MATLHVYRGDSLIERIPIGAHNLRIGRQAENDIVLPDDGKAVSRYHAELRNENGKHVIYDLNSQNGTWVAASRVNRATLAVGQEAVIGPYRIRVSAEDLQQEEAARPTMEAPVPAVTVRPPEDPPSGRPAIPGQRDAIRPLPGSLAPPPRPPGRCRARTPSIRAAGVATLLVIAVAIWMLQAPRPESVQTQSTTTTTIPPEPPKADPDAERLQAATQLVEGGAFAEAVTSQLEPLLAANPDHDQAGLLWTRAQIALAPPPVPRASVPAPAAAANRSSRGSSGFPRSRTPRTGTAWSRRDHSTTTPTSCSAVGLGRGAPVFRASGCDQPGLQGRRRQGPVGPRAHRGGGEGSDGGGSQARGRRGVCRGRQGVRAGAEAGGGRQ